MGDISDSEVSVGDVDVLIGEDDLDVAVNI